MNFLQQNKKALGALLLVVLAVIAIAVTVKSAKASKERAATNMLFEIQSAARPLAAVKNFDAAAKLYEPLLAKFPKSRAAYEAQLLLGDLRMDANAFPEAGKHYETAAKVASDDFSKVLALYNLGIANESGAQYQNAIANYEEALKAKGSEFLRPEILMAQARCYESLDQKAKAIELYKTVQEKYAAKTYYSGAASAYEKQLNSKTL